MVSVLGQEKLCEKINNKRLEDFPHTLLLVGEYGCGKHYISYQISTNYELPLYDISDTLTLDKITEIVLDPSPAFYLIDTNNITIKEQNTILKFLEEPLIGCYIILLTENVSSLLDTILNRCMIWQFEKYDDNTLKSFLRDTNNIQIIEYARTPGQILELLDNNLDEMISYCTTIIDKVPSTNLSNILNILDKIAFDSKSNNTYAYITFIKVLHKVSYDKCVKSNFEDSDFKRFKLVQKLCYESQISNINRKSLFENFLLNLKLTK